MAHCGYGAPGTKAATQTNSETPAGALGRVLFSSWVNRLRNNIFVNPPPLPLSCESPTPSAAGSYGRQAGWLAGRRNTGKFRKFQTWL